MLCYCSVADPDPESSDPCVFGPSGDPDPSDPYVFGPPGDPDPLVRGTDPDPAPSSKNSKKNHYSYCFGDFFSTFYL
jgi:hypothetical protein